MFYDRRSSEKNTVLLLMFSRQALGSAGVFLEKKLANSIQIGYTSTNI